MIHLKEIMYAYMCTYGKCLNRAHYLYDGLYVRSIFSSIKKLCLKLSVNMIYKAKWLVQSIDIFYSFKTRLIKTVKKNLIRVQKHC